jgi:hypothetical protein
LIGELYREGQVYVKEHQAVYDHDFPSFATGVAIPHGIYDEKRNTAYLSIGTSKDTSEFVGDNLAHWGDTELKQQYLTAEKSSFGVMGG